MPKPFNLLPLIAALFFAASAQAQETATTEAEAPTQAEAEEAAQDQATDATDAEPAAEDDAAEVEGLDMGQEIVEDPTYIKETHGDWQLKCFRSEGQEDLCQMYQLLHEDAGNPVAEISLFKLPEGAQAVAGATIIVPLGTLLTQKLLISIDGGTPRGYDYSFCSAVGCFARIGLSAGDVDAFKRGGAASMQIVPAQFPDQKVDIKLSLTGFTAAYDAASTIQN